MYMTITELELLRARLVLRSVQAQLASARRSGDVNHIAACDRAHAHASHVAWVYQERVNAERKQRAVRPNLSVPAMS